MFLLLLFTMGLGILVMSSEIRFLSSWGGTCFTWCLGGWPRKVLAGCLVRRLPCCGSSVRSLESGAVIYSAAGMGLAHSRSWVLICSVSECSPPLLRILEDLVFLWWGRAFSQGQHCAESGKKKHTNVAKIKILTLLCNVSKLSPPEVDCIEL